MFAINALNCSIISQAHHSTAFLFYRLVLGRFQISNIDWDSLAKFQSKTFNKSIRLNESRKSWNFKLVNSYCYNTYKEYSTTNKWITLSKTRISISFFIQIESIHGSSPARSHLFKVNFLFLMSLSIHILYIIGHIISQMFQLL